LLRVIKRIAYSLVTIFAATTLMFYLLHNIPGDVIDLWAYQLMEEMGLRYEDARQVAMVMYVGYGEDRPLHIQYIEYISNLLRGYLGFSPTFRVSVNDIVLKALPWTLFVLSVALILSFSIGVILGLAISWRRKGILGQVVVAYAAFTDAMPDFVTALLLMIIFAINLRLFPLKGAYNPTLEPGLYPAFIFSIFYHAALPIFSYVIEHIGYWALMMKGSAASVLEEDFVKSAEARGLPDKRIMTAYVGRNAVLPLVASLAIQLGTMLGGSTLIETVFSYPGIGYFFAESIGRRDYPVMQGLFFLIILGVVLANLAVDLIYPLIDPRARREVS